MLGIDIGNSAIRIVVVRRNRSGSLVLQQRSELPIEPSELSDPVGLGRRLDVHLRQLSCRDRRAVMTLPPGVCFVRRFELDSDRDGAHWTDGQLLDDLGLLERISKSMLVSTDDLVIDVCRRGDSSAEDAGILVGAAGRAAVQFCRNLTEACGLKVQLLQLRSLAAINGLLPHWCDSDVRNIAVLSLEPQRGDLAVFDANGLVSLQAISASSAELSSDGPAVDDLVDQLHQCFNSMRLSGLDSSPGRLFIAAVSPLAGVLDDLAAVLPGRLGMEVSVCSDWSGQKVLSYSDVADGVDITDYAPALGAAFDGLSFGPCQFDFLHPRCNNGQKKVKISWRPLLLILGVTLSLGLVAFFHMVQQQRRQINMLRNNIAQLQPQRQKMLQDRQSWSLFGSFLPVEQAGRRHCYLEILHEITRLFPETSDAHVTVLTISAVGKAASSTDYDIEIIGNVRAGDVVTEFITRLNDSDMFQEAKLARSLTQDPADTLYPYSFSVMCNLHRSFSPASVSAAATAAAGVVVP